MVHSSFGLMFLSQACGRGFTLLSSRCVLEKPVPSGTQPQCVNEVDSEICYLYKQYWVYGSTLYHSFNYICCLKCVEIYSTVLLPERRANTTLFNSISKQIYYHNPSFSVKFQIKKLKSGTF